MEQILPIKFGKFRITQTACIDTEKGEIVKKDNSYSIEKKVKDNYIVLAFLNYNPSEEDCEFKSVGMRYIKEREDGLEEIIDKFADMITAWHSLKGIVKEFNNDHR